jgi:hypothetical protein
MAFISPIGGKENNKKTQPNIAFPNASFFGLHGRKST